MIKRGYSFQFDVPDDWRQFKKGGQLVLQGPSDEEIIISGWTVRGEGSDSEFLTIREQLLQNAFHSVDLVTSDPTLLVTAPMKHDQISEVLEHWSVSAKTIENDVLFEASIFRSTVGVLLVTFEAPNKIEVRTPYKKLIESVKAVEPYKDVEEFSV